MTDSHDPNQLDPLDDLASAHLDGQTTPTEAAQVAGDAALAARVAELATVRVALQSDGPPVDEARREASIAAALAAFEEDRADAAGPAAGATGVTPIAVAAARRRASRRTVQVIGAVAVAVLLAIAVPLLGGLGADPDAPSEEVATSALEESAQDLDERDGAGDAAAGALDAPMADPLAAATARVDLGTFEDLDALEAALLTYVGAPLAATTDDQATPTTAARSAESGVPSTCSDTPGSGTRVLTGTATLQGRPVLVFVDEGTDGHRTLTVVDAADCSTISTRQLDER